MADQKVSNPPRQNMIGVSPNCRVESRINQQNNFDIQQKKMPNTNQVGKDILEVRYQMKKYTSQRIINSNQPKDISLNANLQEEVKNKLQNSMISSKNKNSNNNILTTPINHTNYNAYNNKSIYLPKPQIIYSDRKPILNQFINIGQNNKVYSGVIPNKLNFQNTPVKCNEQFDTAMTQTSKSTIYIGNQSIIKQQNKVLKEQLLQYKRNERNNSLNLKKETEQFSEQKIRLQSQIRKQRNLKNKLEAQNQRLENRIKELSKALDDQKKQNQQSYRIINDMNFERNELKRKILLMQSKMRNGQGIQQQLKMNIQENKKLKVDLENKKKEIEGIITKNANILTQIQKSNKEVIESYKLKLNKLEHEIQNCKSQNFRKRRGSELENQGFNQLLKSQIQQSTTIKRDLYNQNQSLFNVKNELNNLKYTYNTLQENFQIEKFKWDSQKRKLQNRYAIQIQNMMNQRELYQKSIKQLEQKITYLLNENGQKDEFMKNYLKGLAKTDKQKLNIQEFFEDYEINIPRYSISQYVFSEIQKKLKIILQ